jgi:hypothetical protein
MLVAAAVLPHPPLLVPEVAAGAALELDDLRAACRSALSDLRSSSPDLLAVVGAGPHEFEFAAGRKGSLRPFGIDLDVHTPDVGSPDTDVVDAVTGEAGEPLPLSLTVAAWFLDDVGWQGPVLFYAVPSVLPASDAVAVGRALATRAPRVAMLAMGDGSAGLSEQAPAHLVPGAAAWQEQVSQGLGMAATQQILRWTTADAARFAAAGLAAWQVVAGAAGDQEWSASLLSDSAPYGVAYPVASWRRVHP